MSIFRKLLDAFLLEDGAPSIFGGLLPVSQPLDAANPRDRMTRANVSETQNSRARIGRSGHRR
jgi:hypothetical protein